MYLKMLLLQAGNKITVSELFLLKKLLKYAVLVSLINSFPCS